MWMERRHVTRAVNNIMFPGFIELTCQGSQEVGLQIFHVVLLELGTMSAL